MNYEEKINFLSEIIKKEKIEKVYYDNCVFCYTTNAMIKINLYEENNYKFLARL